MKVLQSSTGVPALLLSQNHRGDKKEDATMMGLIANDLNDVNGKIVMVGSDGDDARVSTEGESWIANGIGYLVFYIYSPINNSYALHFERVSYGDGI